MNLAGFPEGRSGQKLGNRWVQVERTTPSRDHLPQNSGLVTRILLLAFLATLPLDAQIRTMASVVPALVYGPNCSSTIQLQNLSDRMVTVEVEGHRESGALVALAGIPSTTIHLDPHEQGSYRLSIEEETTAAWATVREKVPSPDLSPAVAISATAECTAGNQLRTAARGVAYPTRNPWFSGDVAEMHGNLISLINTSESPVRASACYSSGGLYSVPGSGGTPGSLRPICNASVDVQVPPFNSRQFPVARDGSSHLSLKTQGKAVVLEMLRPLGEDLHVYEVDSSIKFGEEATGK